MRHVRRSAFVMVEIALVVVLAAILALAALPNYLESQTRTKLAGARSDLRRLDQALAAYVADYQAEPRTEMVGDQRGTYSIWWGFSSHLLTTPTAYLAALPSDPFYDQLNSEMWRAIDYKRNTVNNQPYIYIRYTYLPWSWEPGKTYSNIPGWAGSIRLPVPQLFHDLTGHSAWILSSCGPDNIGATIWGTPEFYDPSNGTVSFGDIYRFGPGTADDRTEELH